KGSDILAEALPEFIGENVQIIVLGTGKNHLEKQLEQLEILYPDKARGVTKFNVPLAHMITAGADFMLVPSRFEPCGLIQLHAMRYGTVPIVASTGGLVDTVKEGFT
ncbi:glycosyltransferase, partial [Staphylococcus aureus]|nr:glycosyltransferase [Staphylococcus aureus]